MMTDLLQGIMLNSGYTYNQRLLCSVIHAGDRSWTWLDYGIMGALMLKLRDHSDMSGTCYGFKTGKSLMPVLMAKGWLLLQFKVNLQRNAELSPFTVAYQIYRADGLRHWEIWYLESFSAFNAKLDKAT